MNPLFRKLLLVKHLFLFAPLALLAQVPTDNPYAAKYNPAQHWTSGLRWQNAKDARAVTDLVGPNGVVDSTALHQAFQALSREGGGVLFFPAGTYQFAFTVTLPDGVVLRGADPGSEANAQGAVYTLPTRFVFPQYKAKMSRIRPDTLVFVPDSNYTAFKKIRVARTGTQQVGLVHLDINRALIDFDGRRMLSAAGAPPAAAEEPNDRVILLGIRQNNAVLPDPGIPSAAQLSVGRFWQRWPWHEVGSINVWVKRYGVVAGCRLNDKPDDNYRQMGYMTDDGMSLDGGRVRFDYTDHVGIRAERAAAAGKEEASTSLRTVALGNKQEVGEPAPGGLEVVDNYVKVLEGNEAIQVLGNVQAERNETFLTTYPIKSALKRNGRDAANEQYRPIFEDTTMTLPRLHVNVQQDTLRYRLLLPKEYNPNTKYPVVLFLHGIGERGMDNRLQLRHFIWQFATDEARRKYPCIVVAPQLGWDAPTFTGTVEEPNFAKMERVLAMVKQVQQDYSTDPGRLYLVGISTGGWSTWEAVVKYPKLFAAAVPISAYKRFNEWDKKARKQELKNARQTPIWAFHGGMDEWVPPAFARLSVSEVRQGGGVAKYTEFKEAGHLCWDDIPEVPDFIPWLFAQQRK